MQTYDETPYILVEYADIIVPQGDILERGGDYRNNYHA
jgi:hypothetical protein